MRIVLVEDVQNVGKAGEITKVKNGYARNYLLPRKLAVLATKEESQRAESRARSFADKRAKLISDMSELGEFLDAQKITIETRVGPTGRLYGSVTSAAIADAVGELTERKLDHRVVELHAPLRELGEYDVRLHLAAEIFTNIVVSVEPMGGVAEGVTLPKRGNASDAPVEEPEKAPVLIEVPKALEAVAEVDVAEDDEATEEEAAQEESDGSDADAVDDTSDETPESESEETTEGEEADEENS